ncbi:MAG TPA: TIGR03435 family protein [Bryobacteraceae bacterium]|nr:TIGR03435 family protein [Bryobacteraceae bacterium]
MRSRSRELLAVGIFGPSSLGDRIELLLQRGREFSPHASRKRVATAGLVLLGFVAVGALAPRWIAFAQQEPRPAFDVASIKPSDPAKAVRTGVGFLIQPGGRFTATDATLQQLIGFAYYDDAGAQREIAGGPSWLGSERYTIEAKADSALAIPPGPDGGPAAGFLAQTGPFGQTRLMIQSLLAERFKLALHRETKEEQVYELVVAKGGSKLKETAEPGNLIPFSTFSRGRLVAMRVPISFLAVQLKFLLGRSVIDKSGLTGKYDFELKWTPDPGPTPYDRPGGPDAPNPPPPDPNGPSIFTALQEQLGLRLESAKGPVEILVIDHAERPDAN